MNNSIQKILDDLYTIDPSLREHEEKLTHALSVIIESKPDTKFDEAFARRLKKELLTQSRSVPWAWFASLWQIRAVAFVCLVLLATPLVVRYFISNQPSKETDLSSSEIHISDQGTQAFGPIAFSGGSPQESRAAAPRAADNAPAPKAMTMAGGASTGSSGSVGGGAVGIAPDYVNSTFRYSYGGAPIDISHVSPIAYKRKKGPELLMALVSAISKSSLNVFNMNTFRNTKIQSVTIMADKETPYSITLNYDDGSVSLFGQQQQVLEGGPTLSESETISIARAFLNDLRVNLKSYGDPEVIDAGAYQILTESAPEANMMLRPYIGDSVSVVWPLMIDGKKIYDEGGTAYGITVSVSAHKKQVTGVYNLTSLSFDSSRYELEQDATRIQNIAERGGVYGYLDENAKNSVTLGTPQEILVRHFDYADNASNEFFVPALLFPITHIPNGIQVYQKAIIVPLIKDALDTSNIPPPRPLYMESAQ